MSWPVLLVQGVKNPTGTIDRWDFDELIRRLTYLRNAKDKLSAPGWLPVRIKDEATEDELRFYPDPGADTWTQRPSGRQIAKRRASSVAAVWALVVDIDEGFPGDAWGLSDALHGLNKTSVSHTTWSHTRRQLKARVVFPFDCECPVEKWPKVWRAGQRWAATWGAKVDAACKDPSRLYFLPAAPFDRPSEGMTPDDVRRAMSDEFDHEVIEGDRLSWRWLLAHHGELPPPPIRERPKTPSAGGGTVELGREQAHRRRRALAFLENRADAAANATSGNRNSTLYGAARSCGQHVEAGTLTAAEVRASLSWAGVAAGLSAKEADQTITNGLAKAKEDGPWTY